MTDIPFFHSYDKFQGKLTLRGADQLPREVIDFAREHKVSILDASFGDMKNLPDNLGDMSDLETLYLSNQGFESLPGVLNDIRGLLTVALKSCKLSKWDENSLPVSLRWLILTNNPNLKRIPKSIRNLKHLRKVAMAGLGVEYIPDEMGECESIELLRFSACNLTHGVPFWIFNHSNLTWYGDNGNRFNLYSDIDSSHLFDVSINDIQLLHLISESPSSQVHKAKLNSGELVAVKLFKGELTSDGYPLDDMNSSIKSGTHDNLIKILGKISDLPDGKQGLVLSLVSDEYKKLGNPPSAKSCTRDTFEDGTIFSFDYVLNVLKDVSSACLHLHSRGIMHGDIYAHNILSNSRGNSILGDLGAASFYDPAESNRRELIDVRAFGILIDDLLSRCVTDNIAQHIKLRSLQTNCLSKKVHERLNFREINDFLNNL